MADKQQNKKKLSKNSASAIIRELAPYFSLGTQIAFTILAGSLLGYWIDEKYDTAPLWTVILAITGLIVGMYSFLRKVLQSEKKN